MNINLNKALIRLGFVFLCTVFFFARLSCIKNCVDENNFDAIYFYYNDELIDSNHLSSINDEYLNFLLNTVNKKTGYDYIWSFDKENIVEFEIDKLKLNDNIYLHEVQHLYETVFTNDNIEYEILSTDDLVYNSLLKFRIIGHANEKVTVVINGKVIEAIDGVYECVVTSDLNINISSKDVATIKVTNNKFTYDGNEKEIEFNLESSEELDLEKIKQNVKVKYYLDVNRKYETKPIDAGVYYVSLFYELNDVVIEKVKTSILIEKATPIINSWPVALNNKEGTPLGEVDFIVGDANVKGTFTWTDKEDILTANKEKYSITFIPKNKNYNNVTNEIVVGVLTYTEMLDIVKEEKLNLYNEVCNLDITKVNTLPVKGEYLDTSIKWFSVDTLVSIDKNGTVNIIAKVSNYLVKLYAIVEYDNTIDYLELNYIVNNYEEVSYDEANTDDKIRYVLHEESDEFEYYAPTLNIENITTPKEENKEFITTVQKTVKCKKTSLFIGEVSEIIIWKVISNKDKGDDGSDSSILFKKLNKKLKGERIYE